LPNCLQQVLRAVVWKLAEKKRIPPNRRVLSPNSSLVLTKRSSWHWKVLPNCLQQVLKAGVLKSAKKKEFHQIAVFSLRIQADFKKMFVFKSTPNHFLVFWKIRQMSQLQMVLFGDLNLFERFSNFFLSESFCWWFKKASKCKILMVSVKKRGKNGKFEKVGDFEI
jgi:hypothetical protein